MDSQIQQQEPMFNGNNNNNEDVSLQLKNGSSMEANNNNNNNNNNEDTNNYDDLFPSLPTGNNPAYPSANPIGEWNRKPMLVSTTVTQVFHVPTEERKEHPGTFGGDDSHKALKQAMAKSGAKIEMSAGKDHSLTFLITGKPDAVLRAKRELLVHFQTQASSTISIPKDHHGSILGKGGLKKTELEAKTATRIKIPPIKDDSDEIVITGTREGIEKAVHEIRIISDEQSKQASQVMNIPKIYHPFISGPCNENTKKMISEHPNVRINIPPPSVMKDELSVTGEKEGVEAICAAINGIYRDIERKASVISVEVPKSQHRYVFGVKGQTVNDILGETGVYVDIPPSEVMTDTITLRGPQEKLGLALTKVYEFASSCIVHKVSCKSWLHKYIIGKKGASIQKLTMGLQRAHLSFSETDNCIEVEGPPDEVNAVLSALEPQVKQLNDTMDFADIDVASKYHKFIIGKGGANVNKIKKDTDVMINIPENDTTIRIEGNKDGVNRAKKELLELVSKMENEREKDIIIESRFHRQLIGPKGEKIQKIRDEYPNVQIVFPDLGNVSDIVKVRGSKDEVEKCCRLLNREYRELLETKYQIKVPIFKQFHKCIIGKGGATIHKIRTDTDTQIDLPDSGSDSDVIAITGRKENVEKAEKKLLQIQSEMANVVTDEISIPAKIHNTMIGAGGKLIQSIMDDYGGVSIKFPPSDSGSDKVVIRGPKEDVEQAKKSLLKLSTEKQLSSMTAEVRANPSHHKFLIGRAGANIQSIRDKTGAKIIFPNEKDKDKEVITILGTKEAVAAAKLELEARVKDLDNIVEEIMTVDTKYHRHFVARRGDVLRQIGETYGGVVVSFPRSGVDSDNVTLKGAKNCVEAARKRIAEIVADLENQVTVECVIPQVHHRSVMGARGANVQKVRQDYDVQIKFPDRAVNGEGETNADQTSSDIILITGIGEKCEAASEALKEWVPITIEVEIPFEFHRFVIGQKGAGVRQLIADYGISIKVPPSENESNAVSVTGLAANVADAKAALEARVKEFENDKADKALKSFKVRLEINPEYHPKIIGRKGAIIQKLRQDYDVVIQLPKKDTAEDTAIIITGYEDKANEAKDAILKIVSDIESMCKEEVRVDHRIHSMIIGRRGFGIRKIMADFKVDIKLPRENDSDPDLVVIMGDEENVLDCKDHLLNMEEEYLQEIKHRDYMDTFIHRPSDKKNAEKPVKGFEIGKGAPWHGASEEAFPTLGGNGIASASTDTPVWGPRRF